VAGTGDMLWAYGGVKKKETKKTPSAFGGGCGLKAD